MRQMHAFPVHRQGVPVRAMREALARLERGEVVGMFPEGEIKTGRDSVLRGERIGLIRFGSRMDVWLPEAAEIVVKPGQHVAGGVTVLARWPSGSPNEKART